MKFKTKSNKPMFIFIFYFISKALIKFHFVMFLIIFISYVFASLSILAIVVRVKRSKSFIVAFRAKSNSTTYRSSIAGVGGGGGGMDESMIMIEKGGGGESSSRGVRLLQRNQSSSSSRSFSFKLWPRSSVSLVNSSTRSLSQSRAHKIHDTKILSSISLSFVLLNTPYFIVMFAMFIHANRMTTTSVTNSVDGIVVDLHREEYSEVELVNKMKIQGYIILTETLQLVNFSLTGLLFFCSGQIFRMHALKCLQRALPFL